MKFDLLGKAVRRFRLPAVDYVNAPIIIVPVQEGDVNSRYFEITLYDDHGDMDLSVYSKAMLSGSTPSGIVLTSRECEISADGRTVVVQFGGGFTARAGRVACDIMFTNADNTLVLTTQTFYVIVSESQAGNLVTDNDPDYNELLILLKEVRELENKVETAEGIRISSEISRVDTEKKRVTAENARATAEDTRAAQETVRQTNEATRTSNETDRVAAETVRAAAETDRIAAETDRIAAETDRAASETDRVSSESSRVTVEQSRVAAETIRVTAEETRQTSEDARVAAETQRETDFNAAKGSCETATQGASDAAQDVKELLDALPCPTNKVDGETVIRFASLNFVALRG